MNGQVESIIRELVRGAAEITPDMTLIEDLGFTSLAILELVTRLEEVTGTQIPMQDVQKVVTVADIYSLLSSRTGLNSDS